MKNFSEKVPTLKKSCKRSFSTYGKIYIDPEEHLYAILETYDDIVPDIVAFNPTHPNFNIFEQKLNIVSLPFCIFLYIYFPSTFIIQMT